MKRILSFILLVELFILIFSQVPVWNLSNSAINLLLDNSTPFKYTIYKNDTMNFILTKEIKKTNEDITQQNYVEFNGNIFNTTWEGIHQIYKIGENIYVCPTGKDHLSKYNGNQFEKFYEPKISIEHDWDFTCNYLEKEKNILFISYLHSGDANIYGYKVSKGEWFENKMNEGYLDIIWSNDLIEDNSKIELFSLLLKENFIVVGKVGVTIRNPDDPVTSNMSGDKNIDTILNISNANFDEERNFYWITYNETHFYSGYSEAPLKDISSIQIKKNDYSPFEYFGNVKINYVKLIRNTKYAFYEINVNNKTYHGIIDVKLNKILFNSDENIKDFKPYSKNSLLVVTDKSAYKLCAFALNENRDDCIDQCPEDQSLILDPVNNNHCGKENKCEKYLFKPMDYCIDECNRTFYVIQNETICGLCKYINETHPYKIINKEDCIDEKSNNTYFIDEEKKILNYCDSSCETCFGEKDDQCLSCKNGHMVIDGKCSDKCPDGYYIDSNGICQQCNSNCLTCNGPSIDGNNSCASCDPNKTESILIEVAGLPSNCVSECPNNTILNKDEKKCQKNSSEDSTPSDDKDKGEKDKNKDESPNYLFYILIILIAIILIVLGLIIFKKCRNKKRGDEQLITNINNEINENELKENNRIVD